MNDSIYNRYLSFVMNKGYDCETKPNITDTENIKNVIGVDLIMNYYE